MFRYRLVDHAVPAMWRSLAAARFKADWPSGNAPTPRVRRTIDVREILNGIFYVLSTGCQRQALPKDLPPKSTVWAYFDLCSWDGTLERIHHPLYVVPRAGGTGGKPRARRLSTAKVPTQAERIDKNVALATP